MENAPNPEPRPASEPDPAIRPPAPAEGGPNGSWLSGWLCLLATVFLAASTLNCLLRWLPFSRPWDLGGTILSGLLTWLAYSWTLSDRSTVPTERRGTVAIGLFVLWAVTFPAVLWSLGFR
ncbi:MAG: hypothetical protein GX442_20715 [Candidatus Riflebacteria bacterium]|nr:hypothetical protein [Candidatus Riflebacteria bacterium]